MERFSQFQRALQAAMPNLPLRREEPMAKHTSFRIGGPVKLMALPQTANELEMVCKIAYEWDMIPRIMGNGSNLLVSDEGLDAFVVKTFDGVGDIRRLGEGTIFAGSGALLSKTASFACRCGLKGMEFAHGIPGTIGGAVVMNGGAYGGEIKDIVVKTTYFDLKTGEAGELTEKEHAFAYRTSAYAAGGRVITGVYLQLDPGDPVAIRETMTELSRRRQESQPLDLPSAGSTFKRPEGHYAAALIDQAGLKGLTVGGARVSEKHAGFIVNGGGATCADVLQLIELVRQRVYDAFGVMLELEVKVWDRKERSQ